MNKTDKTDKFEYYRTEKISLLLDTEVFVFGSNEAGRHGAGAAKTAHDLFGAEYNIGVGFSGQTYAIPTKDFDIQTLPLVSINLYVAAFLDVATVCSELDFIVTKIGCGLAGYTDAEIAPMFRLAPKNCTFHESWREYLE